jgi:acyl-CoA thioesterase FadM
MSEDRVVTQRILTRGYELGADGVLPPSALLRYLEHLRWQTLTHDGPIPVRRFWGLGVVRAQALEIFEPIAFHVELELSLWVNRVGRTSFQFAHDIVHVADQRRLAASTATVVALDASRRPTEVASVARDYVIDRPVANVAQPDRGAPPDSWSTPVVLRPSDQDMQQHVNHARYADFVEDARILCARAGGYGPGRWDRPVRTLSIEYEQETRLGDSIAMRTWSVPEDPDGLGFALVRDGSDVLTRARIALVP